MLMTSQQYFLALTNSYNHIQIIYTRMQEDLSSHLSRANQDEFPMDVTLGKRRKEGTYKNTTKHYFSYAEEEHPIAVKISLIKSKGLVRKELQAMEKTKEVIKRNRKDTIREWCKQQNFRNQSTKRREEEHNVETELFFQQNTRVLNTQTSSKLLGANQERI